MADMIANQRIQHSAAGGGLLGEGGDSERRRSLQQRQGLLDDFINRSSSRAVENRGSSLFIRRVADLEDKNRNSGSNNRAAEQHFRDASG